MRGVPVMAVNLRIDVGIGSNAGLIQLNRSFTCQLSTQTSTR
jgi:hypothetical protein